MTVEVIKNITDSIKNDDGEVDFDQLDGFDELLDDDQDRVREAIDKGHIDDGDLMDGMVSPPTLVHH